MIKIGEHRFCLTKDQNIFTEAVDGNVRVLIGPDEAHAGYVIFLSAVQARMFAQILLTKADELPSALRLVKGEK